MNKEKLGKERRVRECFKSLAFWKKLDALMEPYMYSVVIKHLIFVKTNTLKIVEKKLKNNWVKT